MPPTSFGPACSPVRPVSIVRVVTTPPPVPVLRPVRRAFRSLASTIVPAEDLGPEEWDELEARIETAVSERPPHVRRQLRLFIHALEWGPVLRRGRRFSRLDPATRIEILESLQLSRLLVLRRGFWGLRTLVFLGYYGLAGVRTAVGYRGDPRGWIARGANDALRGDAGRELGTDGGTGQ